MTHLEKFKELWSLLRENGPLKTPNVLLCLDDSWNEYEVVEIWASPTDSQVIMYRTPACNAPEGYHLYGDDSKQVRNAAYIYDQVKDLLNPRDKNLF